MHMTKMHIMHWPTVTTFFGLHLVSSCLSLLQGHAKKCDRGMTSQRKHAGVLRIVVALSGVLAVLSHKFQDTLLIMNTILRFVARKVG